MTVDIHDEIDGRSVGQPRAHRPRKRFGVEVRNKPEHRGRSIFHHWDNWGPGWHWYATAKQRDQALAVLNRKSSLLMYRPLDR